MSALAKTPAPTLAHKLRASAAAVAFDAAELRRESRRRDELESKLEPLQADVAMLEGLSAADRQARAEALAGDGAEPDLERQDRIATLTKKVAASADERATLELAIEKVENRITAISQRRAQNEAAEQAGKVQWHEAERDRAIATFGAELNALLTKHLPLIVAADEEVPKKGFGVLDILPTPADKLIDCLARIRQPHPSIPFDLPDWLRENVRPRELPAIREARAAVAARFAAALGESDR